MTAAKAEGFFARPVRRLTPTRGADAGEALAAVREAAAAQDVAALARLLAGTSRAKRFLGAALDLSPFLRDAAVRRPAMLQRILQADTDAHLEHLILAVARAGTTAAATETTVMRDLRLLKNEAHVLIALSDLAGHADVDSTMRRLTRLAEACTRAAVDFLLLDAHRRGKLRVVDPSCPGQGSGLVVLGMGKLGGEELNFSSDIDLVLFFEPEASALPDPSEAGELWARSARRLVRILNDRTEHGYVFRTDLRLRPDPGSTPLAIPVEAALLYYEGRGQNWERAAMIKARPVAGDLEAGERFLAELRPFVWRRYLDYAAIADIHSIKRQIHAHRDLGGIAMAGHDVKLGRGGIREIEFFVQTQQLIAGGRLSELRGRRTVPMLFALAERNWIAVDAASAMARCYRFLRRVEHAVQVVADEQSHALPQTDEGLDRIARLLGLESRDAFAGEFLPVLEEVEHHYAALFEQAPTLAAGQGNLVFTGAGDDPATLDTLTGLGFERPADIARIVRTWHVGRYAATRSAEARERLTELTPALLEAFGRTGRADAALLAFDSFLAGLPAGIQLFALLQSNAKLLGFLVTILGAAPKLAATIARRPHVFDGMLDPSLLSELPDRAYLAARLDAFAGGARHYEDLLDRLRIFAAEQKFLIGLRLLLGAISPERAGEAFSDLADLAIGRTLVLVREEMARTHGTLPGGSVALLGMGRLGSRELTAGSDVDLILLYEHDAEASLSNGAKPLAPAQYFSRLTQRLVAAVSAPTGEGVLYAIDLRLRPSGNKGPVATEISAFAKYQRQDAESWEHMALTRARAIAGDAELCLKASDIVDAVIAGPRDRTALLRDAAAMRDLIALEKPAGGLWDLKLASGGIVDLEFIAQCAVLAGAFAGRERPRSTIDALERLPDGFADPAARSDLLEAGRFYAALTQLLRLCLDAGFTRAEAPPGLTEALLAITGLPSLGVLEAHLAETQNRVRNCFRSIVGGD